MEAGQHSVILFGAGEHGRVIADIARSSGREVVALVDENRSAMGMQGIPLHHDPQEAARRFPAAAWCISIGDNSTREKVTARLLALIPNARFAILIHRSAVVADGVEVGDGSVIMAGAVFNPGTRIGRHCIVNTGACIDHDNVLDDYSSVAPGVTTGGMVRIGLGAAVCIGACVQHGVSIGKHTVIGAGSVVLKNIPESTVAYGVPCRVIRKRNPGDRYL